MHVMEGNSWVGFTSQATWLAIIDHTRWLIDCIFYMGRWIFGIVIASFSRVVFLWQGKPLTDQVYVRISRCYEQPYGEWEVPGSVASFFKYATSTMHNLYICQKFWSNPSLGLRTRSSFETLDFVTWYSILCDVISIEKQNSIHCDTL